MTEPLASPGPNNFSFDPVVLLRAGGGLIGGTLISHLILNTSPTIWQGGLIGLGAYRIQKLINLSDSQENFQALIISAIATIVIAGLFFAKNYSAAIPTLEQFDLILSLDQTNKLTTLFLTSLVVGSNMEKFRSKLDEEFVYNGSYRAVELTGSAIGKLSSSSFESVKKLKGNRALVLKAVRKDGNSIRFASDTLKEDSKVATAAIEANPEAFKDISSTLQGDQKIALLAVKKDGSNIQYVKFERLEFEHQKTIAKEAVTKDPNAFEWVPLHLQDEGEVAFAKPQNEDWVLEVLKRNGLAIQFAIEKHRQNKEIALAAVGQNGLALKHLPDFQKDEEIVLAAVRQNGLALKWAEDSLKTTSTILSAAIKNDGFAIQFANHILNNSNSVSTQETKKVIRQAFKQNGLALRIVKNAQSVKPLVEVAVKQNGLALEWATDEMRKDYDVVFAAVTQNGLALQWAIDFKNDPNTQYEVSPTPYDDIPSGELVDEDTEFFSPRASASSRSSEITETFSNYEPESLRTHPLPRQNIVFIAVRQNGLALQFASEELKDNKKIAIQALAQTENAFDHISETLQNNDDFTLEEIAKNPKLIRLVLEKKDKTFQEELKSIKDDLSKTRLRLKEEYLKRRSFILNALRMNPYCSEYIPKDLQFNQQILSEALKIRQLAESFLREETVAE
jgi:hypothetical protein